MGGYANPLSNIFRLPHRLTPEEERQEQLARMTSDGPRGLTGQGPLMPLPAFSNMGTPPPPPPALIDTNPMSPRVTNLGPAPTPQMPVGLMPQPGVGMEAAPPKPRGLSVPPDPTMEDSGPTGLQPNQPNRFDPRDFSRDYMKSVVPQLSQDEWEAANKPVSTKRAILSGLAATFTPSAAFAPLIAYGSKGLAARQKLANMQGMLPDVVGAGEKIANTDYRVGETANAATKNVAEIDKLKAETNETAVRARRTGSEIMQVTPLMSKYLGLPLGSDMPVDAGVRAVNDITTQTQNAVPKPSESLTITPQIASSEIGLKLGWKSGDKVPTAVYTKMMELSLNDDLDIVSYTDEKVGTSWRVARSKNNGEEVWRSKPEITPNRPPTSAATYILPGNITDPSQTARDIAEYRTPFPANRGTSPAALKYNEELRKQVAALNPNYRAEYYQSFQRTENDAVVGTLAKTSNSLNTMMGHLDVLDKAVDGLKNGQLPILNMLANQLGLQTSSSPVATFNAIINRVAPEVASAYIAGGGGEGERMKMLADFSPNLPPDRIRTNIRTAAQLAYGKLRSNEEQYKRGTYGMGQQKLLFPETEEVLRKFGVVKGSKPEASGKIRVRRSDGVTGTIDEKDFDPKKYTKIE